MKYIKNVYVNGKQKYGVNVEKTAEDMVRLLAQLHFLKQAGEDITLDRTINERCEVTRYIVTRKMRDGIVVHTYDIVDDILMRYIYTESQYQEGTTERDEALSKCWDRCKELYGEETTSRVIHRYLNSKFKRYHGPVFVDAFNGTTVDWNGETIIDTRNTTNKD